MDERIQIRFLERANRYIEDLSAAEKANIIGTPCSTKRKDGYGSDETTTRTRSRTYCRKSPDYIFQTRINALFRSWLHKKTNKTPRQEIEYAMNVYRQLST